MRLRLHCFPIVPLQSNTVELRRDALRYKYNIIPECRLRYCPIHCISSYHKRIDCSGICFHTMERCNCNSDGSRTADWKSIEIITTAQSIRRNRVKRSCIVYDTLLGSTIVFQVSSYSGNISRIVRPRCDNSRHSDSFSRDVDFQFQRLIFTHTY